jgi:hypothetical protein
MFSLALLLVAAQGTGPIEPRDSQPSYREVSWSEFCRNHFQPDWALPMPTQKEVGDLPVDLVAWFQEFTTRDFALAPGTAPQPGHQPFGFGDLAIRLAPLREDSQALLLELERLSPSLPGMSKSERRNLGELLCDAGLYRKNWTPDDNLKDDGILHLQSWELKDNADRSALWKERSGDDTVLRSAALVFADLDAWFTAENDVDAYFTHAANRFEKVSIPSASRVRTKSPQGLEARAQIFRVLSDLPFPFGDYGGDNRVRLSVRPDSLVMNEVYMAKSDDFHWLAGRDVFLPLRSSTGDFIGLVIVQEFGFDIDGVPESDGNRKAAVRAALGNKKRQAELHFRPQEQVPAQRGRLPEIAKPER